MAEDQDESEKTEEPTPKRLQQAREKGDVPKSQEIPGWFVLASGLVVIALLGPAMARHLTGTLTVFLARPHELSVDPAAALDMISGTAWSVGLSVGFAFLILMGAGLAGHLVQTGLMFSAEKMKPKLSKLNPAEGVKRMLGPQGWANFLKGLGKMSLVALAVFVVIWPKRTELAALPALDVSAILQVVMENAIALFAAALVAYAFVAALDYMYQRQSFMKRNRMSRRDVRDELKQTEGDPIIRARLRQIRQDRARRRMMASVPDATVIITNPTHYAVALKYEQGVTAAPICVAKGADAVALRIRELAKANDVPIVEDPPLARALHASVEIDETIPAEHFKAVAKVIGYVLTLAQKRA